MLLAQELILNILLLVLNSSEKVLQEVNTEKDSLIFQLEQDSENSTTLLEELKHTYTIQFHHVLIL